MKHTFYVTSKDPVITLASEITYGQRDEWCGATWRPLKLSLMRSRQFFPYDPTETLPVIIWLCGGGFTNMDCNVWAPEMAWFAKRGYAIVSVEYSVTSRTRFPMQIEDIKQAIRFLRAHAKEYGLDTNRFAVMGESAGGYLSALAGVTGETTELDKGEFLNYSSSVQAAIAWYPITCPTQLNFDPEIVMVPPDMKFYPDIASYITEKTPPFLILHGDADTQVPLGQSELLYETLDAAGVYTDLYVFPKAEHGDSPFVQQETKQIILDFLNKVLV